MAKGRPEIPNCLLKTSQYHVPSKATHSEPVDKWAGSTLFTQIHFITNLISLLAQPKYILLNLLFTIHQLVSPFFRPYSTHINIHFVYFYLFHLFSCY